MDRLKMWIFAATFCIFIGHFGASDTHKWEEIFSIKSGNILSMEYLKESNVIYLGTSKGLYRSENSGGNWRKVDVAGKVSEVRDIAISG